MGYIYCPVCSRAISSQANIKACPNCYQPLNVHEWKEASGGAGMTGTQIT